MKLPTSLLSFIAKARTLLTARSSIGAIEFSATSLKYIAIRNNTLTQASLRLPPGIIEHGRVKNAQLLVQALKSLHQQIAASNKPISAIAVVPQSLVYTQSFTVPLVAPNQMAESIMLNLQMISPIAIDEAFYDYQEVQERSDAGQLELLGAFANKNTVNAYADAMKASGFAPVAVSFPAISLASLVRSRWGGLPQDDDYLVVYLNSEGIMSLILKNGNLFFNRFTPWYEIIKDGPSDAPTFPAIKEFIVEDLQRIITFYLGKTGKQLKNAALISPVFNYEITTLVQEKIGITLHNLAIAELPNLQPSWVITLGAAVRGTVPRSKDVEISLTAENAQTEYFEERILDFISIWRNIIAGALVVVLSAFIFTDQIFTRQQNQLSDQLQIALNINNFKEYTSVQDKIKRFNSLVEIIDKVSQRERSWSYLLSSIKEVAGQSVALTKINVNKNLEFDISGNTQSDETALSFKDQLSRLPFVKTIDLPLDKITKNPQGIVFFQNLQGTLSYLPTSTTQKP